MTMLFGASLVGYLVTRFQNPIWRAGMPGLPNGLWVSTALLVVVSFAFSRRSPRPSRNRFEALEAFLWLAGAAALGFLVMQAQNWHVMMRAEAVRRPARSTPSPSSCSRASTPPRVIGGFVPLAIVIRKTRLRQYSSSRLEGLVLCRRYWDFLGVVWLVLLAAMYVAT